MIVVVFRLLLALLWLSKCNGLKIGSQRAQFRSCSSRLRMAHVNEKYPLQNDLIIRAAKGKVVEKTPVWIFRQAGRHLPEYNAYKKEKGKNFLEMLEDPADVAEVTMQPIRRYNLDAAILFSDILVILQALDIEVTMPGGVGIQVPRPLKDASEVATRLPTSVDVRVKLSHVLDAISLIKEELKGKVPLIGFSAAPWTLMFYLVGGSSKKGQTLASTWLKESPAESKKIMDLLTDTVIEYMSAQISQGADLMQVFEAMGDHISEEDFHAWALPSLEKIATELRERHPGVPLLVFPRGASYALEKMQEIGYDVVTLDTSAGRKETIRMLNAAAAKTMPPRGSAASVQGNLPVSFLEAGKHSPEEVVGATRQMLEEFGPQNLIANLGEGLTGKEDPVLVAAFVDAVHELSSGMINGKK